MLLITKNLRLRKRLKNVIWMLLLLQISLICGQELNRPLRVVIDPGHGGIDSGAVGVNGIKEKDLVLEIALRMAQLNEFDGIPAEYFLTRYTDTLISLGDRTKLARMLKADYYISLHINDARNRNASGVEVFVSNQENRYSRQSIWLGLVLGKSLVRHTGQRNRGVKFANFQVLRETVDYCPSILVELGFLSNEDESRYLTQSNQNEILAYLINHELHRKR